ncbi:hypothetical protein [Pseudomonas fluorescens]|uniref:hypothetical protein n=1 Tax=Pseudomonas fluorescens TaxID=294 RepID=UPI001CD73A3F|nr:hypothetical protein [Pseudomonas fluorescens]
MIDVLTPAHQSFACTATHLPLLKKSSIALKFFSKRSVFHLYALSEKPTLNRSTADFAQSLSGAIAFSHTILGNRQRRAWEQLINYIRSSDSLPEFDKASARAEGYVQALVDSEQIDTKSTERDLLIIATIDEWRRHHIHMNTKTCL